MKTPHVFFSLALLLSVPCSFVCAAENRTEMSESNVQEIVDMRLDLVRSILQNQDAIVVELLRLVDGTTRELKETGDAITSVLQALAEILQNQHEIFGLTEQLKGVFAETVRGIAVKLKEGEERYALWLIIKHQHAILDNLRAVLGTNTDVTAREAEDLSVRNYDDAIRVILTNQHEIITMLQGIASEKTTN
jgi:hypothetical protein